jgi:hypothetical protein
MTKKILLWEPSPWPIQIALLSSIGKALTCRGHEAMIITFDGLKKEYAEAFCLIDHDYDSDESYEDWSNSCNKRLTSCKTEAQKFGIKRVNLAKLVDESKRKELKDISQSINPQEIKSFAHEGIPLGINVYSSCVRYYKCSTYDFEEKIVRKFALVALLCLEASKQAIQKHKPDVILMTHGIYAYWGPMKYYAHSQNVDVVSLSGCHKKRHVFLQHTNGRQFFQRGAPTLEEWNVMKAQTISTKQSEALRDYFDERYNEGSADIGKARKRHSEVKTLRSALGFSGRKPIWGIFPNLLWDAAVDSTDIAFATPEEWLLETLEMVKERNDVEWFLKVHPAESITNTKFGVVEKIKAHFGYFPQNVKLIDSEDEVSTFDVLKLMDGGISLVGNTTGFETLLLGKPWITGGECIYSKKGFSLDGLTKEKYFSYLNEVPDHPKLSPTQCRQLDRLAYYYFIERQLPLEMFDLSEGRFAAFNDQKKEMLESGKNPIISMICDQIASGNMDFRIPTTILN